MKDLTVGQGKGQEGRFLGLPDPYGSRQRAKIALLPVPYDKTTSYQHGADLGPEALIEASRNIELYDIETHSEVYQQGIYTAEPVVVETSERMLAEVYRRTLELIDEDKFVVTLGGEHSISYAPIRAHADRFGPISVLQFDAHADLHPAYERNPWSHASVMARVKELPKVLKIVSVGIRSMSAEELPLLDRDNTFFAHQIDGGDWMKQVLGKLSEKVYITFDLDVFDASLMPSTGTPEPGGLFWKQATELLSLVMQNRQVVGCDVVELLPNPHNVAPDYTAAKLVYKMLSYRFRR
jgi:agmatinase